MIKLILFQLSMEQPPSGWEIRYSRSNNNRPYYFNPKTKESSWERPPDGPQVRASHLLVKHRDSRRPSSWRQESITISKEEAMAMIEKFRERIVSGEVDIATLARYQ